MMPSDAQKNKNRLSGNEAQVLILYKANRLILMYSRDYEPTAPVLSLVCFLFT